VRLRGVARRVGARVVGETDGLAGETDGLAGGVVDALRASTGSGDTGSEPHAVTGASSDSARTADAAECRRDGRCMAGLLPFAASQVES